MSANDRHFHIMEFCPLAMVAIFIVVAVLISANEQSLWTEWGQATIE